MRRGAVIAVTVMVLGSGCAPGALPTSPPADPPTPAVPSPTPTGVCVGDLPDSWQRALSEGEVPERKGMATSVLYIGQDGASLVVVTPEPGELSPGPSEETPRVPGPTTGPQDESTASPDDEPSEQPGDEHSPSDGSSREAGTRPASFPADGPAPRPAELWWFDRDFTNPVRVMTAPQPGDTFLSADFDGRYYAFMVGENADRGAAVYAWDSFAQDEPSLVTENDQGRVTDPLVDRSVVVWGQTTGEAEGQLVSFDLASSRRGILERTWFAPDAHPQRDGSTVVWVDDRSNVRALDMHTGADVPVPGTIRELTSVQDFATHRDLWLWTTRENEVYAWHTAWPKPILVATTDGVTAPSIGDNYAVFQTTEGVYLWDSRAQSAAEIGDAGSSAQMSGPWLLMRTKDRTVVVNSRRLPPLLPC